MRFTHCLLVITQSLSLLLFCPSSVPGSVPGVIYGDTFVEWSPPVPNVGMGLTVSGPEGFYLKQEQAAGGWARFSFVDQQGRMRPDGVYKWELVAQEGLEATGEATQSGWFSLRGGQVVEEGTGEKQSVVLEDGAPGNTLYVDRQGRVGLGTSVPGAQLHLKGTEPSIALEDTQAGGREYLLRSQQPGNGSLGLFDETNGKARWLVDGEGRMGINTDRPTSTLTVDGYIETTKGFLVNGRPLPAFGGIVGTRPLAAEGYTNNFFGTGAGGSNTTGDTNSFFGGDAGYSNNTGQSNSFFGYWAGRANTSGYYNCSFGRSAGTATTTGHSNSFFGHLTGDSNFTGNENSAFGESAGGGNTIGSANSYFGVSAGVTNTQESNNTFIGAYADLNPGSDPFLNPVTNATAIGYRSYVSRSNSLVLGGVNGVNGASVETFVGIGTSSPDRQLVVEGAQALGKFRRYSDLTPTHSPAFLFERARGVVLSPVDVIPGDYLGKVQFRGRVGGNMIEYGALAFIASDTSQNGRFSFVDRDLATERMVILNSGSVGIGTTSPTALLDVAGNLRVRGTIQYGVPAPAVVPDYVFERDYRLMPLPQLAHYVQTEKHLPNIPKASEIGENGVDLGDFQMKLLEKVEELTLYTVQQAEVIERQKEEAAVLKQRAASQEERLKALEQMVKTLLEKR